MSGVRNQAQCHRVQLGGPFALPQQVLYRDRCTQTLELPTLLCDLARPSAVFRLSVPSLRMLYGFAALQQYSVCPAAVHVGMDALDPSDGIDSHLIHGFTL